MLQPANAKGISNIIKRSFTLKHLLQKTSSSYYAIKAPNK
ncbi:hypothetical protein PUND_a1340 [Pseudoalteromonas undina]|nr:hypothetical protein PUND_a1340 [Pseudoalteromonas undina]